MRYLFRLLFFVYAVTAGFIPCRANLEDTLDQCIARYGQPDLKKGSGYGFAKDGYSITVVLVDGVVKSETIFKKDFSAFSDNELEVFLKADSVGGTWNKLAPLAKDKDSTMWTRPDGAKAYFTGRKVLSLVSKTFVPPDHN